MSKIVLATANPHKVEELRAILTGVELLGLGDVPGGPFAEPQEVGTSFAQNAKIKAMAYASATGHLCLADDSGLVIDALGGRPGVISSHYYNDGMDDGKGRAERDALNNARVLRELEGVGEGQRTARFVCVMALARPRLGGAEVLATSEGAFEGRIGVPPRVPSGGNGFGYDPLFLVAPEFARTGAELSSEEKNARSHRAQAAMRMRRTLTALGLCESTGA